MDESSKGTTKEELEAFIQHNKRWLPDEAEELLRTMSSQDQRRVISAGTMSSVRDPTAVIQTRVRKARQLEATEAGGSGGRVVEKLSNGSGGGSDVFSHPASKEELELFISQNKQWLQGEAERTLRNLSQVDQRRVISAGTMSSVRDPVAVIQTRVRKARQMEAELQAMQQPKGDQPPPPSTEPSFQAVTFTAQMAEAHLFAPLELVDRKSSKFQPFVPGATIDSEPLVSNVEGIGGIIEVIKPKYGFGRGQRARCIGETPALLQFDGGRTVPKNQEGKGWRWVIGEEASETQPANGAVSALRQPRTRSATPPGEQSRRRHKSPSAAPSKASSSKESKKSSSSSESEAASESEAESSAAKSSTKKSPSPAKESSMKRSESRSKDKKRKTSRSPSKKKKKAKAKSRSSSRSSSNAKEAKRKKEKKEKDEKKKDKKRKQSRSPSRQKEKRRKESRSTSPKSKQKKKRSVSPSSNSSRPAKRRRSSSSSSSASKRHKKRKKR